MKIAAPVGAWVTLYWPTTYNSKNRGMITDLITLIQEGQNVVKIPSRLHASLDSPWYSKSLVMSFEHFRRKYRRCLIERQRARRHRHRQPHIPPGHVVTQAEVEAKLVGLTDREFDRIALLGLPSRLMLPPPG